MFFFYYRYSNYLEVWKLGTYAVNNKGDVTISNFQLKQNIHKDINNQLEQESEIDSIKYNTSNVSEKQKQNLKLTEQPVKLVSLETKGKKHIKCCEMSPSGEIIVYSTDSNLRMLKLEYVSIF